MANVNIEERKKLVLAMEFIARHVNDEMIAQDWLIDGVADGDIPFGSTDMSDVDDNYVNSNKDFSEMMKVFLDTMSRANRSGGLYCDRVVSSKTR